MEPQAWFARGRLQKIFWRLVSYNMGDSLEVVVIRYNSLTPSKISADRMRDIAGISQCYESSGKTRPLCAGRKR